MRERSAARMLVDALVINGVDTVYCVPGESYLAALDALYDTKSIRTISCRHEASAANMADAEGKLTGRPGIAFVTRGPGATHASIGVHTAMQDSSPMIVFMGQVARGMTGREAFQEIDVTKVFGGLAKWAVQIDDPARTPEIVTRAFATALSGRPGPVVVALPEDYLRESAIAADCPPAIGAQAGATPEDAARFDAALGAAERPLVILGGSGWNAEATAAFRRYARARGVPVTCAFRRQHLFDAREAAYAGDVGIGIDPALAKRVREADLIAAIGTRLSEAVTAGYQLLEAPNPKQRLLHVHADPNEIGRVYQPAMGIVANPGAFALALARVAGVERDAGDGAAAGGRSFAPWTRAARDDYERSLEPVEARGDFDLALAVRHLDRTLPEESIICNGAGNFAAWVHRYYRFKAFGTQLAPTSGAMGYGVPATIAAKLRYPERAVVGFSGDGDFLMAAQELATAVQYGANAVFLVVNNGLYGTIRMHQEREYPGRSIATDLVNPDFVQFARSFGAYAEAVERTEDFPAAFERASACGRPAVLDLHVEPDVITTRARLSDIREKALAAKR